MWLKCGVGILETYSLYLNLLKIFGSEWTPESEHRKCERRTHNKAAQIRFLQAPLKLKLIGDPCQRYSALTSTTGPVNNDVHLASRYIYTMGGNKWCSRVVCCEVTARLVSCRLNDLKHGKWFNYIYPLRPLTSSVRAHALNPVRPDPGIILFVEGVLHLFN